VKELLLLHRQLQEKNDSEEEVNRQPQQQQQETANEVVDNRDAKEGILNNDESLLHVLSDLNQTWDEGKREESTVHTAITDASSSSSLSSVEPMSSTTQGLQSILKQTNPPSAFAMTKKHVTFGKIEIHEYEQQEVDTTGAIVDTKLTDEGKSTQQWHSRVLYPLDEYETRFKPKKNESLTPNARHLYPAEDGMGEWMMRDANSSSSSTQTRIHSTRTNESKNGTTARSLTAKSWLSSRVRRVKQRKSRNEKHGKYSETIVPEPAH
jgi:hypothetical protein